MNANISSKNKVVGEVSSENVLEGGVGNRRGIDGASAYEIAVRHGYKGTEAEWVNAHFGKNGLTPYIKNGYWWIGNENTGVKVTQNMTDAHNEYLASSGRIGHINYSLLDELRNRDRVYVERSSEEGGGLSPLYPLSANADKFFNPLGFESLEEMCEIYGWNVENVEEGVHYIKQTVCLPTPQGFVDCYHPALFSVVARQYDGNIRVNLVPKSSNDATSKSYVDGHLNAKINANSISASNTDNCILARVANGGGYYGIPTALNPLGKVDIPQRNVKGEMRCRVDDSSDGTSCVNKSYLAQRLSTYLGNVTLNPTTDKVSIPQRNAKGEMRCKVDDTSDSSSCVNKAYMNSKLNALIKRIEALEKK